MFEKTENVEKEAEDGRFKAIQTLKTLNKILLWRKDLLPQKRFAASAPDSMSFIIITLFLGHKSFQLSSIDYFCLLRTPLSF